MSFRLMTWVSSWAVLVLAGASAPAAMAKSSVVDRVEASVNNEIILRSDLNQFRATMKLRLQLDPLFTDSPLARKAPSDSEIVDFLVNERVILMNFPVGDDEVEQEIRGIETKNKITRSTLQAALAQQGFDFSSYFKMIRTSIAKRKLIDRDIRTKVFISDDDVRNFYFNQHASSGKKSSAYVIKAITTKDIDDARAALDEIKTGKSFEDTAKRFSDSPSAATGADLGTFSEGEMSPLIRETVKGLKLGQVSSIVGSKETTFMVLKLIDIKTAHDSEFNRVKEEIRASLAAQEFRRQIELWSDRKRQEAFVHVSKYD